MRRRTFEEMITYFNQTVSEMDIDREYKMILLGIVTALLQKHDEDVAQIVRCKDCKHWDADEHDCNIKTGWFACGADWFCADGERK